MLAFIRIEECWLLARDVDQTSDPDAQLIIWIGEKPVATGGLKYKQDTSTQQQFSYTLMVIYYMLYLFKLL